MDLCDKSHDWLIRDKHKDVLLVIPNFVMESILVSPDLPLKRRFIVRDIWKDKIFDISEEVFDDEYWSRTDHPWIVVVNPSEWNKPD